MPNLSELRDLIRAEAVVNGLRESQTLIDNMIIQELQRFTGKSKWAELFTVAEFTLTDEQNSFMLPSDFQLFESLSFCRKDDTHSYEIIRGLVIGQNGVQGVPKFYYRNATVLAIYPFSGIQLGDKLILAYYKKPEMILDADDLPIPSLEIALIQAVMGRLFVQTDTRKAQAARQESEFAYQNARSQAAST